MPACRIVHGHAGVRMVQQPHPDWQPGQSMMHPFPSSETIDLDPAELGARGMYPFVISSIVPRPIAFICSVSKQASTLFAIMT